MGHNIFNWFYISASASTNFNINKYLSGFISKKQQNNLSTYSDISISIKEINSVESNQRLPINQFLSRSAVDNLIESISTRTN